MRILHAAFCICGKDYSAFFSAGSSGFRDFAGCFGRDPHHEGQNAFVLHLAHGHMKVLEGKGLPGLGDVLQLGQRPACRAGKIAFAVLGFAAHRLEQIVHGSVAVHPIQAIAHQLDGAFLRLIGLVEDFTHQFLQQILHGHNAQGSAVIVNDHGHVLFFAAQFRQQVAGVLGAVHKGHIPAHFAQLHRFPFGQAGQQVLGVQHADDVVNVPFVYRNAGVAALQHRVQNFLLRGVGFHRH